MNIPTIIISDPFIDVIARLRIERFHDPLLGGAISLAGPILFKKTGVGNTKAVFRLGFDSGRSPFVLIT